MDHGSVEAKALAGDAAAFGSLIREYDHDLRGVVWSVVRSSHATDDVMQVAYEKAFRSVGSFDGRSALKTWMHSICYRAALDHVRYESRRRHEDLDSVKWLASNDDVSAQAMTRAELEESFGGLDDEQRAVLMLTVGLGYSYDETATIVDMRRGTVASRVSRARKQMQKRRGTL